MSAFGCQGQRRDAQGFITEVGDMVVYCAGFPAISPPKSSDSLSSLPAPEIQIFLNGASFESALVYDIGQN